MQKIFTKYMSGVIIVALLVVAGICWLLLGKAAQGHMVQNAKQKIEQAAGTIEGNNAEIAGLKDSLSEDYLTRARAFAYIIQQNPKVLESQEELERIKELLNVDELHVINGDGILFAGTIPKYFGMDFASTEQTSEFLKILEDPDSVLVQEIQPNGAEKKIFQYVGVARQDEKGIVQIGMAPVRLLEAQKKNELSYIFSRVPVDPGSVIFAVDSATGVILASTDERMNEKSMEVLGLSKDSIDEYSEGGFAAGEGGRRYFVLEHKDGLVIGVGKEEQALYSERGRQMFIIFFAILIIGLITVTAIRRLLKIKIVDGMHRIMGGLEDITEGRLGTAVEVNDNPEFQQLSAGINKMVKSILGTTVKVSKVIDIVDLPIGAFEFSQKMDEVMATERLRQIMMWSEEEAGKLYEDKELFKKRLKEIMDCEKREGEAYKISSEPEKWVRIHMTTEEEGTFGVVMDITKEVCDKKKLEHDRDYDALTGLRNISAFKRDVCRVLRDTENTGTAAVVMLDLDHFKEINDQYGHDWGDDYLQICARFLKIFDNDRGITARRSGDEFCICFHGWESKEAVLGALDRFYSLVEEKKILFPDMTTRSLSISSGLAWYGESCNAAAADLDTAEAAEQEYAALMKTADEVLYRAKNEGRGKYMVSGQAY